MHRRSVMVILAGVLLALVLGGGWTVWRLFFYRSPIAKGLEALQTAYRSGRPLESRISGFSYAPLTSLRGTSTADENAHALATHLLLEAVYDQPSAESRHALGRYYLTERQYDRAIAELQSALRADAENPRLQNDLAVAFFEKGRNETGEQGNGDIEAFARSLELLNRALRAAPSFPEVLFNRALLRQQMMLTERAEEDWHAYLEQDSTSRWADEARQHLQRIEERRQAVERGLNDLVQHFLEAFRARDEERVWKIFSSNREKLITELLAIHLERVVQNTGSPGGEALDALAYAGQLDMARVHDAYTAQRVRFYQLASPRQLLQGQKANRLMRQAREFYEQSQVEKAARLRDQARQLFTPIGDLNGARLATYWLALHNWELGRTQQSLSLFDPLLRDCEPSRCRWLRARALYQRATLASKLDEHSSAIAYYQQAQALAEQVGEVQCDLDARGGLIEKYRRLGNQPDCFQQIARSQHLLEASALGPLPLCRYYTYLTMAFHTFGFPAAAIDYARESLRFANNFTTRSVCFAHIGLMYGKVADFDKAFDNVRQAYSTASAHEDTSLGQLMMAYAAVQAGHLHRERGEYIEALGRYDEAIDIHQRHALDFSPHLYQAYKGRLFCYTALHQTVAAQQQLETLFELMDRHRAKILEEENRDHFFDVEQSVYDAGIHLAFSQLQDEAKAFEYTETSRARSLLDSIIAGAQVIERGGSLATLLQSAACPLPLAEIQMRIPDDVRLLEYAVLDEQLLIWVISRRTSKATPVAVPQAVLTEEVGQFLASLRAGGEAANAETTRLAQALFSRLIAPIVAQLDGCQRLIIVPDKALNRLPWDALMSPDSERFLLEDYQVVLSPSATLFAVCTDFAAQKSDLREERILSVGNPGFDTHAFPQLRSLPAAADEAEEISGLYASRQLLIGPAARESTVREELARADLAHFALHCLINEQSAMRSSLVLAKEPANTTDPQATDGLLEAHEVYTLKAPRLRLVVLSGCQTGVERYYRGEGMIGVARAFLVAHVPLVVASLWPVDSDATAQLMIQFHRFRKAYRDHPMATAEALRQAKLALLLETAGRYRQPFYWAAFQVIGGQANF
ncbi:MAG: CHAT domain-containing protein [Blastocatellia bacterium]